MDEFIECIRFVHGLLRHVLRYVERLLTRLNPRAIPPIVPPPARPAFARPLLADADTSSSEPDMRSAGGKGVRRGRTRGSAVIRRCVYGSHTQHRVPLV